MTDQEWRTRVEQNADRAIHPSLDSMLLDICRNYEVGTILQHLAEAVTITNSIPTVILEKNENMLNALIQITEVDEDSPTEVGTYYGSWKKCQNIASEAIERAKKL